MSAFDIAAVSAALGMRFNEIGGNTITFYEECRNASQAFSEFDYPDYPAALHDFVSGVIKYRNAQKKWPNEDQYYELAQAAFDYQQEHGL